MSAEELAEMLLSALMNMDREQLRKIAAAAVARFAGMEPGRPVGGTYYLYRTLRQLDYDGLVAKMMGKAREQQQNDNDDLDSLAERFQREEFEERLKVLRDLVESEIRRRLVADRGAEAMARTLRKPLPEDVDFMHASREEMLALQRAIYPLTRAMAARLAQRRKRRNRGNLDFRATVRHSLSYGGVPAEPKFRHPRPSRPEIMVVADISGSVASFARFTLQFVYAMAAQFSKVRSWVFIDGIDEVTRFFQESDEITEAVHRVNTEADVVWVDGHSDYGHAFEVFHQRHFTEITPKTSVILLGDARNNYHASESWVVDELSNRARHVYWLNPEPRGYWDSGDSIVSEYGKFCDGVFECRNLRQLERFVTDIVDGWSTEIPSGGLRVAPHRPFGRGVAVGLEGVDDAEAEAGVEGEVPLLVGLEVGGQSLGIGALEHRLEQPTPEPLALEGGIDAERHEVPVRHLRMHLFDGAEVPQRRLDRARALRSQRERGGQLSDLAQFDGG